MKNAVALGALCAFVACTAAHAQGKGEVAGKVTFKKEDGSPAEDAVGVVYLEGVPAPAAANTEKPKIRQKDLTFEPGLTVVQTGTSIEFPNEDKVFHNVFSVSSPARFDLGLYKNGSSKTVTFNRPGTVDIFCNIHPQMVAKVKVVDGPYFAVTGKDGSFRIAGVPAGTWSVVAWQPYGPEYRGKVTVTAGKTEELAVELTQGKRERWHLRKDGTPYGRYK